MTGLASFLLPKELPKISPIGEPRDASAFTVTGTQQALIRLGYLPFGFDSGVFDSTTTRALQRFQRHARRPYRMSALTGLPEDVEPDECFAGACDARIDTATTVELRRWIGRAWQLPIGRFRLAPIPPGRTRLTRRALLREDVLAAWLAVLAEARQRGATVDGPYGDTWRPLGFHRKDGTSPRSFHIAGRAIDLNQRLAHTPAQRYFPLPRRHGDAVRFQVLCRAARQDGSQGRYYCAGSEESWRFGASGYPIPGGWYVDLTALLHEGGFEGIVAQPGWESSYLRSEWWHFQYRHQKQDTFLDECELVGIGEEQLLRAGYAIADMDGQPG
ncbi:MAG: peptidoglycan-binding domain-containing protein [Bryobacteraceae bacterium]